MTQGREKGLKIEISVAKDKCGHFDFGAFERKRLKIDGERGKRLGKLKRHI